MRRWLYDLHTADPETVSEIIWETSGPICVRRGPAPPVGTDPGSGGSPERERDSAAYLGAMAGRLLGMEFRGIVDPGRAQGRRARPAEARPGLRGGVS